MRNRKIAFFDAHKELTSGIRATVAQVQDLCIDVSLHSPTHVATCAYDGPTHELDVRVIPRANLNKEKGGNGSFDAEWSDYLYLPGRPDGGATPDVHKALASLCLRLQAHLPPSHTPGGAA